MDWLIVHIFYLLPLISVKDNMHALKYDVWCILLYCPALFSAYSQVNCTWRNNTTGVWKQTSLFCYTMWLTLMLFFFCWSNLKFYLHFSKTSYAVAFIFAFLCVILVLEYWIFKLLSLWCTIYQIFKGTGAATISTHRVCRVIC